MPVTINGNGAISGLGDIDGHDLETATLVVSGDTTMGPQAVGRATLFVDDSANSVGINTTTPASGVFLEVADGTDPIVSLNNTGNGDLTLGCVAGGGYIGPESAHSLALQTSGTTRVHVTSEGLVGVSTTTPDADFTATINAGSNPDALLIERTLGGAGAGVRLGLRNSDNENWTIFNNGDANLLFETDQGAFNGNPKLILKPDGRHVINRGTSAQTYTALEIFQENTSLANTFRAALAVWDNTYNGENSGGIIDLGGLDQAGGSFRTYGGIRGVKENATDGNTSGRLEFWTRQNNGTYSKKAEFTQAGHLYFARANAGIQFANNPGNILHDYEEGTWTPTVSSQHATSLDLGLVTVDGSYVKIGKTVLAYYAINFGTSGAGVTVDDRFTMGGLPFNVGYGTIIVGSQTAGQYTQMSSGNNAFWNAGLGSSGGNSWYLYCTHIDGNVNYDRSIRAYMMYETED